jgi:hypothetical protein
VATAFVAASFDQHFCFFFHHWRSVAGQCASCGVRCHVPFACALLEESACACKCTCISCFVYNLHCAWRPCARAALTCTEPSPVSSSSTVSQ